MANSKKKGSKNERDVCKFWKEWSGLSFTRVPASGGLRWKKTDNITGDIICDDERKSRRFPFSIEAKFYKDINFEHMILGNKKQKFIEFWEQAKEDAERGNKLPILFARYNGMPKMVWFVAIPISIWEILQKMKFKAQGTFFIVSTPDDDFIIMNSSELLQIDFKTFSINCKKLNRNAKNR